MRYIWWGILDSGTMVIQGFLETYFPKELDVLFNCLLQFLHAGPLKCVDIQGCQGLIHYLQIRAVILNPN